MKAEKIKPDEEMIGLRLVKERLLSESQLNTALDFQKAVGGKLVDVIARLKFVDSDNLNEILNSFGFPEAKTNSVSSSPKESEVQGPPRGSRQDKTVSMLEDSVKEALSVEFNQTVVTEEGDNQPEKTSVLPNSPKSAVVLNALINLLVENGIIDQEQLHQKIRQVDVKKVT